MPRALFLSHIPIFPTIGGDRIRIAQSLRLLSEKYDTDVAYLTNFRENESIRNNIPAVKNEISFYSTKVQRYIRGLKTLINNKTLYENLYLNSAMMQYLRKVYRDYDVVFCGSVAVGQYMFGLKGPRKVLDMTDSLTMNFSNSLTGKRGLQKWLKGIDMKRMGNYELRCKKEFDAIAYISSVDAHYIAGYEEKVHVVGNAVKISSHSRPADKKDRKHLVFVGKMDYEPNIRAVKFFAKEVFPLVRAENPDIRFSIVGISPTPEVRALEKIDGVEVTGYVESIEEWLDRAIFFVAPMLSGSGVQNKILQAMAAGCLVITTPLGVEGIETLRDVIEVVEPHPQDWKRKIIELIGNSAYVREKASKGPDAVEKEFGITKIRQQFSALL